VSLLSIRIDVALHVLLTEQHPGSPFEGGLAGM
jgi:hypothetical protein